MTDTPPTNLIQLGDWTLHSGLHSRFKLVADAFIHDNLPGLVELIRQLVGPFSSVEGVPTGGLVLAEALRPFAGLSGKHLIVDDCLTTGGSLRAARDAYGERCRSENKPENVVVGAVAFARGQCPLWVKAVFQLPEQLWLQPRHR